MTSTVTVRVPATTANLGPGFDCFGMALSLFNTVTLAASDRLEVVVKGEGATEISLRRDNLAARTIEAFFAAIERQVPPLRIGLDNAIPLARGLGSSAAAIVGSLVAANEFVGRPLPVEQLLKLATEIEGHPDNVAAALLGGFTICVSNSNGSGLRYATVPVPTELRAVLFIPHFRVSTERARAVLPGQVSRRDAVHNIGRASLLVAGLTTGRFDILRVATEDRLHQPYRESLFPAAKKLFAAALEAGALGVFLSGAGPTILALVKGNEERVATRFEEMARDVGTAGRTLILDICHTGAAVIRGATTR